MAEPPVLQDVRVLVVHADGAVGDAVTELLGSVGAQVTATTTVVEGAEAVRRELPHVVLVDHALEAGGGSLVRRVAGDPDLLGTSVVIMHPGASVDEVLAALAAGAADVWAAESAQPSLIARVRLAVRQRELLDLALRRYSDLEDLAYRDDLTELPNRRGTSRQLEVLLSRSRRHGHQLSVLVVDADRFKDINDEHGHAAGDIVLRELAARLRRRVRREDLVGRWGGEEFLVVLPETTPDAALAVAESLRHAAADGGVEVAGTTIDVTVSIGLAGWIGEGPDELLDRADAALYAAKAAGRDRVMVATPSAARGL